MRISDWSSDVCSSDLCCGRILLVDATFGLAIQNNNTDTPVNGGGGIIFNQTDRRSQAQYPFDLRLGHAARHKFLASRSEEHTSELQSLMRISYAVFCLKKKIHLLYSTSHTL